MKNIEPIEIEMFTEGIGEELINSDEEYFFYYIILIK